MRVNCNIITALKCFVLEVPEDIRKKYSTVVLLVNQFFFK
jgi:hypothetical protein